MHRNSCLEKMLGRHSAAAAGTSSTPCERNRLPTCSHGTLLPEIRSPSWQPPVPRKHKKNNSAFHQNSPRERHKTSQRTSEPPSVKRRLQQPCASHSCSRISGAGTLSV